MEKTSEDLDLSRGTLLEALVVTAQEVEEPASVDYVVEGDDEVVGGDGLGEGCAQDVDEEHQEGNL